MKSMTHLEKVISFSKRCFANKYWQIDLQKTLVYRIYDIIKENICE